MPTVTFRVHPPEFRWGQASFDFSGGLWILRGLGAADDLGVNTTTQRFFPICSPLPLTGEATAAAATFRAPKPFTIHTLAMLFTAAFPGGTSASFRFNIDGVTRSEILMDLVATETKKVATGEIAVSQDSMVCMECTAEVGGAPDIKSISIAYKTRAGADPNI